MPALRRSWHPGHQGENEGRLQHAAGINYGLLRQQAALSRLKELESFAPR
jgi:hypothetical protein